MTMSNTLLKLALTLLALPQVVPLSLTLTDDTLDPDGSFTATPGHNVELVCKGSGPLVWFRDTLKLAMEPSDSTEVGFENLRIEEEFRENLNSGSGEYISKLTVDEIHYRNVGSYKCAYQQSCINPNDCSDEIYLYVRDEENLLPFPSMALFSFRSDADFVVIPCKPSFPEVEVTLLEPSNEEVRTSSYSSRIGFTLESRSSRRGVRRYRCEASYKKQRVKIWLIRDDEYVEEVKGSPIVMVQGNGFWQQNTFNVSEYDIVAGEDVNMRCSVSKMIGGPEPIWSYERNQDMTRLVEFRDGGDQILKILQPQISDSGVYVCYGRNRQYNSTVENVFLNVLDNTSAMLQLSDSPQDINLPATLKEINWYIHFRAYPMPSFTWIRNGETILNLANDVVEKKYQNHYMNVSRMEGVVLLQLKSPSVKDIGRYQLKTTVKPLDGVEEHVISKDIFFNLTIEGPPAALSIRKSSMSEVVAEGESVEVSCTGWGYPLPKLELYFSSCATMNNCSDPIKVSDRFQKESARCEDMDHPDCKHVMSRVTETWDLEAKFSGIFNCSANNTVGKISSGELLLSVSDKLGEDEPVYPLSLEMSVGTSRTVYDGSVIHRTEILEGGSFSLTCRANNFLMGGYYPRIIQGIMDDCNDIETCRYMEGNGEPHLTLSRHSHLTTFEYKKISGDPECKCYTCEVDPEESTATLIVKVKKKVAPAFTSFLNATYIRNQHEELVLKCGADGIPKPQVYWLKDGARLWPEDGRISVDEDSHTLTIDFLKTDDNGNYQCVTRQTESFPSISQSTHVSVSDLERTVLFSIAFIVPVILIIIVIVIIIRLLKNQRKNKEDWNLQHEAFLRGDVENLNSDLGIDEQAELLPYEKKFEFPRDKIVYDKLLGSGAFGRVYRAKAKGIVEEEEETTVAIKTIKSRTSHLQLRALRSECKIMMHIGRHLNIVNLLGACSADVASRGELSLIVEYCPYGNILTYMRQKKNNFKNQIGESGRIVPTPIYQNYKQLSNKRESQPLLYVNLEEQTSNGSIVMRHPSIQNGDCFSLPRNGFRRSGSHNSDRAQSINHHPFATISRSSKLNSNSSSLDDRAGENGSSYRWSSNGTPTSPVFQATSQPFNIPQNISPREICANGENTPNMNGGDGFVGNGNRQSVRYCKQESSVPTDTTVGYIDGENYINSIDDENLTTQKLLSWSYQIANGMEYLSGKKVMHGDLAARNILLSKNNVVKISDFGMAKDIYKYDHYTKKSKVPMPLKWMSLEAIREGIYSTQSDVWSFGVTMWEIFSLGQVPYPTVELNVTFPEMLAGGLRLEKPPYANDQLYMIMSRCWDAKPTKRPLFDALAEYLGEMMAETERQFYLDLNRPNVETQMSDSILDKIRSPDIRDVMPMEEEMDTQMLTMKSQSMDNDGYLVPQQLDNRLSTESCMARKNIHNLTFQYPQENYLAMVTKSTPPALSPRTPISPYYTSMAGRSATPSTGVTTPGQFNHMQQRSYSMSPVMRSPQTAYNDSVFQFPPNDVPNALYMRNLQTHDSGIYSPTKFQCANPEYFYPPEDNKSQSLKMAEPSDMRHIMTRTTSLPADNDNSCGTYINIPGRNHRLRTYSDASSGLGSIEEDPSRENLLKSVSKHLGVPRSIPEEPSMFQVESTV